MERGALVVQHDVVRAGNGDQEVDAGDRQQRHQRVHVVLVGLGMVGVADVDAHRHAQQLAAEMIFQSGADDLLAVIKIFRADEADHGVDQQRRKGPGNGIGAGLDGLLIDAVMGVGGQRRTLSRFEIHHVVADGAALQATARHPVPHAGCSG